jgi:DNA-binding response OmpR family regulator
MKNRQQKILIIDDTPAVIDFVRETLLKDGYQVFVAISGQKGLEIVDKVSPDIILLDILMPDLNGYETCAFLKANKGTVDIPVIFMSALTETSDKQKGFQVGAVDYLTKPLNSEELLIRINAHLSLVEKTKREREGVREVNSAIIRSLGEIVYEYDVENDVITWSDTSFDVLGFTPKEMGEDVAKFLIRVLPDDRELVQREVIKTIEGCKNTNFDFQMVAKDHQCIWFQSTANVIVDEATGKAKTVVGVLLNMTARKEIERNNYVHIVRSVELERERIAERIETDLGDVLLSVVDEISTLSLSSNESVEVISCVKEAISKAKLLVKGLRPVVLSEQGFTYSMQQLIDDFLNKKSIKIKFSDNSAGKNSLPDYVSCQILNITQDILNTIFRNDEVSMITLQLHTTSKTVFYTIEDNGKKGGGQDSIELKSLKDRVAAIGGMIEVNYVVDRGTLFAIDFAVK